MAVVVNLDGDVIGYADPVLRADDAIVTRGEGVFETLLVRDGRPCLLAAHLDRLAASASIVGLPEPDLARWRVAAGIAAAHWDVDGAAVMRFVYGKGAAFVVVSAVPDRVAAARRDGLSVITLQRGPSSLAGAKSLSYAVNAAALRHARSQGADDAIFVDADGFVLEGPRSSVVIAPEIGTLATPSTTERSMAILPGTTQRALYDTARERGWQCVYAPIKVADLKAAQGVWLLSSVTLAARVHTLDGHPLGPNVLGEDFTSLVELAVAQEADQGPS